MIEENLRFLSINEIKFSYLSFKSSYSAFFFAPTCLEFGPNIEFWDLGLRYG